MQRTGRSCDVKLAPSRGARTPRIATAGIRRASTPPCGSALRLIKDIVHCVAAGRREDHQQRKQRNSEEPPPFQHRQNCSPRQYHRQCNLEFAIRWLQSSCSIEKEINVRSQRSKPKGIGLGAAASPELKSLSPSEPQALSKAQEPNVTSTPI